MEWFRKTELEVVVGEDRVPPAELPRYQMNHTCETSKVCSAIALAVDAPWPFARLK